MTFFVDVGNIKDIFIALDLSILSLKNSDYSGLVNKL